MSDDEVRMKRPLDNEREDDDDDSQGHTKRQRVEGPKIELRILLRSKQAGAVIGKSGTNINRLRIDYKASVTVSNNNGPERILTIGAELDTVLEVLLDVIPTLNEHRDGEYEVRMLVHQSQTGCIIGRAGFKIKDLCEEIGANIKVFSQCCPNSTDRVASISGKPQVCVGCIKGIIDSLQSAPPKGPIQHYDSRNFDEFYAHDYGGYMLSEGGRGKMGSGGTRILGAPPPPLTLGGLSNLRGPMGPPGMRGSMRGPAGMGPGDDGPKQSTQVTIPKGVVGAIIGKGGSRITEIRRRSMAQIVIDEAVQGSNDCIITITGTTEQIRNAQYLLQMRLSAVNQSGSNNNRH